MRKPLSLLPLIFWLLIGMMLGLGILMQLRDKPPSPMLGEPMPALDLPTLGSSARFSDHLWKDKIVVLNVFASWCLPCAQEHPALMRLAESGKADILGIAWKDSPQKVSAWLAGRGNPYRAVGIDETRATTTALGLTGVPETFIIDRSGRIVYHRKVALSQEMVEDEILPLIDYLRGQHE